MAGLLQLHLSPCLACCYCCHLLKLWLAVYCLRLKSKLAMPMRLLLLMLLCDCLSRWWVGLKPGKKGSEICKQCVRVCCSVDCATDPFAEGGLIAWLPETLIHQQDCSIVQLVPDAASDRLQSATCQCCKRAQHQLQEPPPA
jgi:hypothetical protein